MIDKNQFGFGGPRSPAKDLELLHRDIVSFVRSTSARVGPVPFSVLGAHFGRRARRLGLSISDYLENHTAFVVSRPTPFSRACELSEGMTVKDRVMAIVVDEDTMVFDKLIDMMMDLGVTREETIAAVEELHNEKRLIHGPYLSFGDVVRVP